MVDAIDAWVDVIFFAVAIQPLRRRPLRSLNLSPTQQQPSTRHGANLQRASPNLWVSVFRSLFIVFHCILHCHCSVSTLFIVLNGFGVSGLKRNSNHKLERRDDPFKLRENGTNGFGAETQPQPQTILKSKKTQNAKRFVASVR